MIMYLVRHTAVDVARGVCYGQSNVALKESYPVDLGALRKKLAGVDFEEFYSSALDRCLTLAKDLSAGSDVRIDHRLLELNFGDWELKAWDDIDSKEAREWGDNFYSYPCPNGESFQDLRTRVVSFLRDITEKSEEKTILVITHGGVIRCLLTEVLGASIRDAFKLQIDYAGVSRITHNDGKYKISFINK